MTLEPKENREAHEEHAANLAHADAAHREAYDYWGYLFKKDKCGTPLLDRLLKGIAEVISKKFDPSDSPDLTPSQLAAWYRHVGGDYNLLFTDTPPSSIAFIYRSLGAFHSLQPAPSDDGYGSPTIPALKKQGFVTWQTIQLLLGPEEHVPFLQKAVEKDDVIDPETGNAFPKILPKECFPERPDDAMETWYQGVAARLRREAEEEANGARVADEPRPRISTDMSGEGTSADEKHGAFRYFEDPMYRRSRPRPSFMRHVSKQAARPVEDHGRAVASRVRHMLNPFGSRKKNMPGRYENDSLSDDEDATPIAAAPPQALRYPSHKRPHPQRRDDSLSTTDSDSDSDRPPSRRHTPPLRHRRSHETPTSPLEYFPAYYEGPRRYSHQPDANIRAEGRGSKATSPLPVYGPTQSPMFATHVAQLEARNYYDRRPSMPPRPSYRPVPQNVKWGSPSVPVGPSREGEAPYTRDDGRERERRRSDRDREGRAVSHDVGGSSRARRRRSTEDAAYPRERERDNARTRSHDRVKDEWDERIGSRERDRSRDDSRSRDRERDRDRDRRGAHRYVGQLVQFLKGF
ncbi:uncharacterized protein K460DRAFT_339091 [Cucurbitaria berberidis CBS 394.84]|uniref:DUF7514 domain-containing protein n=1 Tax=Cucurbitaria berberidis CBS 394.84 TaxID=1168544 RepID=A0A9P4L9E6_9PLEO|nr:uncharacterized protein K460DRAFT_339091 [Cucurbitaria berberidis CBS 394.84]KAF1846139.1 hypothetical protein K460DRAFT_339091 [Cucurbitaria berberidis CBS 394.84]